MSNEIRETVFRLLFEYGGRKPISGESMIVADLRIGGADSVQLLDELEDRFGVDLRPLVERGPPERTGLLHRLFGAPQRPSGVDVSVRELIDFIAKNRSADTNM